MKILLLIVLVKFVVSESDWEVYKHELYDIASSIDWNSVNSDSSLTPLTLIDPSICTPTSSMYLAGGKNKIIRSIQMPTTRKFSAIQIYLDFYFIDIWMNTTVLFYLNNGIIMKEQPYKIPTTPPTTLSTVYCTIPPSANQVDDYIVRFTHTSDFIEDKLNLEILVIGLPVTRIYALQNFYLLIQYCDINCLECDNSGKCIKCPDELDLIDGSCLCSKKSLNKYSFYSGGYLSCVFPCPNGYLPDINKVCQQGTQDLLFEDLTGTFSSYFFFVEKDKYYTDQSNNDYRIMTIEGSTVAGPISFNENLVYKPLSILPNSYVLIKFKFYVLRTEQSVQIGGQVKFKINGYQVLQITDYDGANLFSQRGSGVVSEFKKCKFNNYDKCFVNEIEFLFNANYEITEIKLESHFTISEPRRTWAIRDFQIKKITYSNPMVNECENNCQTCEYNKPKNCKTCQIGYYLFDKVCLQNCPSQTTQFGSVCKEDNIVENVDYLLNVLYNDGNFEKEIDIIDTTKQSMKFSKFQYGIKSYTLLGGFKLWDYQTLYYQITSTQNFYKAYLKFNVVCIDCSTTTSLQLDINFIGLTQTSVLIGGSDFILTNIGQIYGQGPQNEYHGKFFLNLFSLTSLTMLHSITLKFSKVSLQPFEYLGIYNLRLMVVHCPLFCDTCDQTGLCLGFMLDTSLNQVLGSCISGYFYDSKTKKCQQCGSGCSDCDSEFECSACNVGYILHEKVCYCTNSLEIFSVCTVSSNCQIGCLICGEGPQFSKLSPILNTNYLQCTKCDDTLHYWLDIDTCRCLDGYYMDQIICQPCSKFCKACKQQPKVCTSCNTNLNRILHYQQCECIDGYYEQENTVECSKCDIVCYTCRFFANYCTSCYPDQYREIINRNCECIDGYYDDGSTICKKCDSKCKACLDQDTCISCFPYQNRKLSLYSNKCICKIGYFEVENQLSCDSCHFSCKTCLQSSLNNMCTRCPSSREPSINDTIFQCLCKRGYYESNMNECSDCRNYKNPPSTHYCYSNCGDKLLQWNEECDDGNNEPKDGCYQCLLPGSYCFNELCIKCEMGICIQCIDGYFLNTDNICEKCDQSCKTCLTKYDNCTSCVLQNQDKTGCIMCQIDKGYQIKDDQCIPICGDGLRVNQENCDDGNDKNGDGCYECKVEDGWICDTVCERIIYPIVIFEEDKFDNQYDSIRNIVIQTNIELRITGSINNLCQFSIKNNEIFQIIKNTDITDYNDNFSILKFSLKLQLENLNLNPILICTIKDKTSFISQQGFTFNQTSFEFEMLKYNKQSRSVVQATEGLLSFSKYILYILLGLAIFAFLVGGLDIFFNLLDVLQLISYLQFFNIVYPYNVETYFQLFDFAQFDFIKQIVNIEEIINQYVESPQPDYKFAQQGYSSTFYINGIAVFTVFITTIAIFIGCKYGFLFLAKLLQYYSDEDDTSLEEEPNVVKFILFRILRGVQKLFLNTLGEFSSGVIRTFMAITYDYNIAIFLQIRAYNSESKILASSYAFSVIFLLLQINFLFEGFKIMGNKLYYFKSFFIKRHYGALYEGINIRNSSPYSNYYNLVLFIKKIMFIVFLVNLYNETCFQIFMCSALNILFIIYIHYNQPLEEKYEYYKTIGSEIFIWIAEMLIIILYYGQQQGFDQSQELLVGWFIIAFCTLLILFQFVIDVKQHFTFLIREYKILSRLFYRLRSLFRNGQQPIEETQQQENLVEVTNSGKQSKKVSKVTLKTKSTTATSLHKQRKLVTFTIKN